MSPLPPPPVRPLLRVLPYLSYPCGIPHYVPSPLRHQPQTFLSALKTEDVNNREVNRLIDLSRQYPVDAKDTGVQQGRGKGPPDSNEMLDDTMAMIWGVQDFSKMGHAPRPWSGRRGDKMQWYVCSCWTQAPSSTAVANRISSALRSFFRPPSRQDGIILQYALRPLRTFLRLRS